jgi:ribonuclease VapC
VIVDTSVLVAIVHREPEGPAFARIIAGQPVARISAASYVELAAVVDGRRDPVASNALDSILRELEIEVAPLTAHQARIAREAYRSFGRGSGHPARLNMGDCFAYALARDLAEPLLFKGRDFALTDIELVIEPDPRKRLSEVVARYGTNAP